MKTKYFYCSSPLFSQASAKMSLSLEVMISIQPAGKKEILTPQKIFKFNADYLGS